MYKVRQIWHQLALVNRSAKYCALSLSFPHLLFSKYIFIFIYCADSVKGEIIPAAYISPGHQETQIARPQLPGNIVIYILNHIQWCTHRPHAVEYKWSPCQLWLIFSKAIRLYGVIVIIFKYLQQESQIILKGWQLNAKSSVISYTLVWLTNIRRKWESRQCLDLRRTANTPIRTSSLNKSNGSPVARRAVNVAPGGDPAMYSHTFTNKVDLFSTAVFIEAKRKGINSTT